MLWIKFREFIEHIDLKRIEMLIRVVVLKKCFLRVPIPYKIPIYNYVNRGI
jgi:hypothetical protein